MLNEANCSNAGVPTEDGPRNLAEKGRRIVSGGRAVTGHMRLACELSQGPSGGRTNEKRRRRQKNKCHGA